ncbi:Tetracycline resistance protein, putative, major facilitator superfamily [Thermococcus gammatolerans EJ3]|uniref:Tetracycline resistance protein, putative, major facilitator superfamily n=2 Tax=Thermococcus TaxID=2263 RepID=C5A6Q3_THEGJ|nr:Tetracycline resistance protein, putative, major facilitator superfamily [Thermococcus gammatolerans EJ3]
MASMRDVWLLNFSTFFFFLGISVVTPVVSPFLVSLHAEPFLVGLIAGVTSFLALISKPVGGAIGDRGYRFHALVGGNLLGLLSGLLYVVSAITANVYLFAFARAIHGFSMGLFFPSSLSTAVDLAPEGRVGETLGWRGMMFSLGNILGPAIGGYASDVIGFAGAFALTALFSGVGALFALTAWRGAVEVVRPREHERASYRELLRVTFVSASLTLFLFSMSYAGVITYLPALYKSLSLPQSLFGYYMMVIGIFSFMTRLIGGRSADRHGPLPVITFGLSLLLLGYVLLNLYTLPPRSYVSASLVGAGFGLAVPAMQLMALGNLPRRIRTMGSGIYTMFFDLGMLAGQVSLGYVAQLRGYTGVFPLLPLILGVGFITLYAPIIWGKLNAR